MKPRKGWKVVSAEKDGRLYSCVVSHSIVEYAVGKRTTPRTGAGPLCVFATKKGALAFCRNLPLPNGLVYPCIFLPSKGQYIYYITRFGATISKIMYSTSIDFLPKGTVLADWVELTEE